MLCIRLHSPLARTSREEERKGKQRTRNKNAVIAERWNNSNKIIPKYKIFSFIEIYSLQIFVYTPMFRRSIAFGFEARTSYMIYCICIVNRSFVRRTGRIE